MINEIIRKYYKILLFFLNSDCQLRAANLAGADLELCDLSGSDLNEANLRGSNLKDTLLESMQSPLHMSQTIR